MPSDDSGDALPKVGFVVQFMGDPTYEGQFFKITEKEPLDYNSGGTSGTPEFSTVASGGSSGFKDIQVLQSDKSHLRAAYLEWGIYDGMTYQMKLKSGTIRLGPDGDKNSARINNIDTSYVDPNSDYAFWLFGQDWYPSINANNLTPWALTPRITFKGYKYELILASPDETQRAQVSGRYTLLTLGGVPT